jgi:hypothetical protein
MSYARFGWDGSDVYVFEHAGGFIQCCGCLLTEPEDGEDLGFANFKTPREALAHLEKHVSAGNCVPERTFERMREEYKDSMDTQIEPYVTPPEVEARRREKMKKWLDHTN